MLESVDVGGQDGGDYEVATGREVIERLRTLTEPLRANWVWRCYVDTLEPHPGP